MQFTSGADMFRGLAERMDRLGDGRIPDAVTQALQESVPDVDEAARKGAEKTLPARGGLNIRIRDRLRLSTRLRTGQKTTLTVEAVPTDDSFRDPKAADRGRLRHPTFGRPRSLVVQLVRPGWWSQSLAEVHPQITERVRTRVTDTLKDT